jgi:replicative DNA helicase
MEGLHSASDHEEDVRQERLRSVAGLILERFKGREGVVAAGFTDGSGRDAFSPKHIDAPQVSAKKFTTLHLEGKQCLGFYLCDENWCVSCSCVDFDNKEKDPDPEWMEKTEATVEFLQGLGIEPLVERSQSGCAAHVWVFIDGKIPSREIRRFWHIVSAKTGIHHKEVYPRSDSPSGGALGNLCRYPLWNLSAFLSCDGEWTELDPAEALSGVKLVHPDEIRELTIRLGGEVESTEQGFQPQDNGIPVRVQKLLSRPGLLSRRWEGDTSGMKDPSQSGLAMSIASLLVRAFVPTNEIEQAIAVWSQSNGCDKANRPEWMSRTIEKAYDLVREPVKEETISVVTFKEASLGFVNQLRRGPTPMISAGVKELDEAIGGIEFGEINVIAARPSMGKSAFALQVMEGASFSGYPSLIVSLEMSRIQLAKRNLRRFSRIKDDDWASQADDLEREIEREFSARAPMYIAENTWSLDAICHVIEQQVQLNGVRVVAVDYIQLIDGKGREAHEKIESACKTLSELTRRNNIIMLMLAQVNRDGERDMKGAPRLPRVSDIRGSGFIEQAADVISLLHWDWRALGGDTPKDKYTIIAAKCRNRAIRGDMVVETRFNADKQKFGYDACNGMLDSKFITGSY